MSKLLNFVAALLMLPVAIEAQDYSKYYQNLPVEVKQVSRPMIPSNEINIKEWFNNFPIPLNTCVFITKH